MSIYFNQRTKPRIPISGKIRYARVSGDEWYDANLKDSTREGISFVSEFPYLPGTRIFVKSEDRREDTWERAEIRWSKPIGEIAKKNAKYRIGAKFMSRYY